MRLREMTIAEFNLPMTLDSGQVFHWESYGQGFVGAVEEAAAYVEQQGAIVRYTGVGAKVLRHYFAFDHSLAEICASFPRDPVLDTARDFCRGLRIIRQPKWECLATFICSSMKQVKHIRQISRSLRERFGERREICGGEVRIFPSVERVACASEKQLRECALGYRAKNLRATAQQIASGAADLELWSGLSDSELHEHLCGLPGVGAKVANCVMLFAYERIGAFPIDVWIERVLREQYFARKEAATKRDLAEFATDYFGGYGGYAQQYLFHYARMTARRKERQEL